MATAWLVACALLTVFVEARAQQASATAAEDAPAGLYAGRPGRYEVVSTDSRLGLEVVELGEAVWSHLAVALSLPTEGFVTPITVRLIPSKRWDYPEDSRLWTEAAGRVTMDIRIGEDAGDEAILRGLVRALLAKRGALNANYGYEPGVPLWLELGCARWVMARRQPAAHDQWMQECERVPMPPLLATLAWQRDRPAAPGLEHAAYGVMLWLNALGADSGQWTEFLRRQLAGVPGANSLAAFAGQPWRVYDDVELAWRVALQDILHREQFPQLSVSASRDFLREWSRVVLNDTRKRTDELITPATLWSHRKETAVRAVCLRRTGEIELRLGLMHPFFRNAANSLGRFYLLIKDGKSKSACMAAWQRYEADLREAESLAAASATLLDRFSGRTPAVRVSR